MAERSIPSISHSFWFDLVLPRAVILLTVMGLGSALRLPVPVLYLLLPSDGLFFVWQFIRFQSSADDHLRSLGGLAPVWGGYLVLLFAAFASASLWWGAFLFTQQPQAPELFTDQMNRQHAAKYELILSQDGSTLHFDGTITFGLTKHVRTLMAETPQLTTITLSSPGGHIYEARGFANLIREQGLNTHATGACSSACTLLFIAGHQRSLAAGVNLGFHSYALEFGTALPQLDLQKEQAKDRAFFRSQGVSEDFLIRMFDTPSTGLWSPNRSEARQAGLLSP
ncbi:hypothetical protein FEE96_19660 [Parasedimentitalea maritima]|uniref:Clp protease n=1 Tax=Parasedimentitalea maritima TaxID=2578117 RepID=A0ABY2UQL5_9RHOB|nr:hypothetical protein FEE96_19660 [Zongyanglinia marina]